LAGDPPNPVLYTMYQTQLLPENPAEADLVIHRADSLHAIS